MYRTPHKTNHRNKIWMIVLITLLLFGVVLVLEKNHIINLLDKTGPQSGPTKKQQAQEAQENAQDKQQFLDSSTNDKSTSSTPSATSTPSQAQSAGQLTISASQSGSSVTVLSRIQNIESGTCKLTITVNNISTSQTADLIYQPEFSSCAGFSIPVSSVGTGTWNIEVVVQPSEGASLTKSVILEAK